MSESGVINSYDGISPEDGSRGCVGPDSGTESSRGEYTKRSIACPGKVSAEPVAYLKGHVQHQEGQWDYAKQPSHGCGKDAGGGGGGGFDRRFMKLPMFGESSLVVDDILT